jgi:hypothetical protein
MFNYITVSIPHEWEYQQDAKHNQVEYGYKTIDNVTYLLIILDFICCLFSHADNLKIEDGKHVCKYHVWHVI